MSFLHQVRGVGSHPHKPPGCHWLTATFWNQYDDLTFAESLQQCQVRPVLKQQSLLLPGLFELCRGNAVTKANPIIFFPPLSRTLRACHLESKTYQNWREHKGWLLQPPTQGTPSRTNHPRCRLVIYVHSRPVYLSRRNDPLPRHPRAQGGELGCDGDAFSFPTILIGGSDSWSLC